jgi:ubiquinone/menaquinone biosynthesis C-methylase UbiE
MGRDPGMDRENKKVSEEFGLSSESEAVKEYVRVNRDIMSCNYPLIADEIILKPSQEKSCILDLGTGLGSLAREFAKRMPACRVYGIDISVEMLTEAHRINTREGISNLTLMLSDINHIAFEDNVFDGIVSFGVLHHLSTLKKAFSEIRRVLKERGEAFLYDLRKNPPQELVSEIADGMSPSHKPVFLESVKEGLDVSSIEAIVQGLGVTRYSLSYPTFSRATVVKNKSILQTSRFLGKRFNQLMVMIYLQK